MFQTILFRRPTKLSIYNLADFWLFFNTKTAPGQLLVRTRGLEPPRACAHRLLKPACLPVPTRPHRLNYKLKLNLNQ